MKYYGCYFSNIIKYSLVYLLLNCCVIADDHDMDADNTNIHHDHLDERRIRESNHYRELMNLHRSKIHEFAVQHKLSVDQVCTILTCVEYGAYSNKSLAAICKNKQIMDVFKDFYARNDLKFISEQMVYGIKGEKILPKDAAEQQQLNAMKDSFCAFENAKKYGVKTNQNLTTSPSSKGHQLALFIHKYRHIIDNTADNYFNEWLSHQDHKRTLKHSIQEISVNLQLKEYYRKMFYQKITHSLQVAIFQMSTMDELTDKRFIETLKSVIRIAAKS